VSKKRSRDQYSSNMVPLYKPEEDAKNDELLIMENSSE
jgi:hypothetical protein